MNLHCLTLVCIYGPGVQLAVCGLDVESAGKSLFVLKVFGYDSVFLMGRLEASPLPQGSCSKAFTSDFAPESQNFIK